MNTPVIVQQIFKSVQKRATNGKYLIDIKKEFVCKRPRTFLRLSKNGRTEFENYQQQMKQFLENI